MKENPSKNHDPKLRHVFREDLKQRRTIFETIKRDYRELKAYFLSEEKKKRLARMSWIRRWFVMTWWLLKTLFLKLTPGRRLLLLLALILFLSGDTIIVGNDNLSIQGDNSILAPLLLLFVLMLELKDKLLAKGELEGGRSVQQALMPHPSPGVGNWDIWMYSDPAIEIGGDLIDYFKIHERRHALVLGDISGKGLGAALLMGKLQATIRALLPDYTSLEALGKKLNSIFFRDTPSNRFASCIYLEITPDEPTIRFINAGHLPPLKLSFESVHQSPKGQPAFGLKPETTYTEKRIHFKKDEMFLVYSDGITEARDETGALFGEDRLNAILKQIVHMPAQEAAKYILKEINRFRGSALPSDDISLIVLKYTA